MMTHDDVPGDSAADEETDSHGSSEKYGQGLGVDMLHPHEIVTFLRSIPRRISSAAIDGDQSTDIERLTDTLDRQIREIRKLGYPIGSDDQDLAEFGTTAAVTRASAAAYELSCWASGVPDLAWNEQSLALDGLRRTVVETAWVLRQLEHDVASFDEPGPHSKGAQRDEQ